MTTELMGFEGSFKDREKHVRRLSDEEVRALALAIRLNMQQTWGLARPGEHRPPKYWTARNSIIICKSELLRRGKSIRGMSIAEA